MATPSLGVLYNAILATGTVNHDINAHAHVALPGSEDGFNAQVETEGAANFQSAEDGRFILAEERTFLRQVE